MIERMRQRRSEMERTIEELGSKDPRKCIDPLEDPNEEVDVC